MTIQSNASEKSIESFSKSLPNDKEKKETPPSQQPELLPHQATYDVKLHPSRSQPTSSLQGTMTYEMVPYGNEFIVKQSANINVGENGDYTQSTLTSHERNDGLTYGFTAQAISDSESENGDHSSPDPSAAPSPLQEQQNAALQEKIQCHARLTGQGGAGTVVYAAPDDATIDLPPGTIFPITHLKMLIEKAKKIVPRSVQMLNAIVFDGSNDVRAAVRIHAIISLIDAKKHMITLKHPPFTSMPTLYQAEMRIYTMDTSEGKEAEPYKIIQIFSENGILFKIIVKNDEEEMILTLTELKLFTEKNAEASLVMPK